MKINVWRIIKFWNDEAEVCRAQVENFLKNFISYFGFLFPKKAHYVKKNVIY